VDGIHGRNTWRMKVYKEMSRPWNPTKVEIKRWFKTKELEFVMKDNKKLKLTLHKYLDKYIFSNLHEVFSVISRIFCSSGY
jgi:hypothetical protein